MRIFLPLFLFAFLFVPALSFAHAGDAETNGVSMMHWMSENVCGGWSWIAALTWLVWLVAGVLLIGWLWQQLTKKKK